MNKSKLYQLLMGASVFLLSSQSFAQTDLTNSPGTVTAQYTDSPTNEDISKVIDNQSSTKYLTFHASGWIQFQAASSYIVNRYSITSANDFDARDPKDWALQGSVNGTSWVPLDTRTNEDFPARFLRREFSFTNSNAYNYYRLQMTNNSGSILQLAEWELFGQPVNQNVATVYKHCQFSTAGYAVPLPAGSYTSAQLTARGILNNDVSSLRVNSGYEVVLYDLDNFQGTSVTVRGDLSCLTSNSFNDRATSLIVRAITNNQAPAASITSPANNSSFVEPATITVQASATDVDGTIAKVEFFQGTTKLGEDLSAPYTFTWTGVAAGNYVLTVKATDNGGLTASSVPVNVQVTTNNDGWANFQYPTIVFTDRSPSHPGSQIFHRAIPDPVAAMREQILALVKKLHYNANDNIRSFTRLNFIIEDYDGVAEKWGGPPEIWIRVSTRHIQNVYNQSGQNDAAIRTEIMGILSHEGTHGYQYEPKNAGEYDGNSDFYGFIEGLADYVRISVGLHPGRFPSTGGSWRHGYTTSGFFINYLVRYKDPNFAIKFNHTARTYATWSWDAACREILGVGVQQLWNEYQAWLQNGGSFTVAMKTGIVFTNYEMEAHTCVHHSHAKLGHTEETEPFTVLTNTADNHLTLLSNDGSKINSVEVHSVSGNVFEVTTNGESIDVSNLTDGIYILLIETKEGKLQREKVLIQR